MPTSAVNAAPREQDRDAQNPNLLEARASFTGDATAPVAVGATVAETVQDWGVHRQAEQARHVAAVQTAWLLTGESPGGLITVQLRLEIVRRELTIILGGSGTLVPTAPIDTRIRSLLRGCFHVDARGDAEGRQLICVMKILPDWRVRLSWHPDRLGGLCHPSVSYEPAETRQRALALGWTYLRGIGSGAEPCALRAVHIQGPEHDEHEWELVGDPHRAEADAT